MEFDKGKRENVTYILLYSKGRGWRYTDGAHCVNFTLSGPMPQFCIPNDAIWRGNYTLGGGSTVLTVNYFEYLRGSFKGSYQNAVTDCIPVKNDGHSVRNPNVDQEQFFNYVPSVNAAVFNVPSFCPQ